MKSSRRSFTLVELIVLVLVIMVLASVLFATAIVVSKNGTSAGRQKCSNNLKGIGISLILYAGDYRFFPHMSARKSENTPELVSRVYETLIFFKFYDNPEGLVCPKSLERPVLLAESVRNDPRTIDLASKDGAGGDREVKPVARGPSVKIMDSPCLSYTYIKNRLNQNAAPKDMVLCADKDFIKEGVSKPGFFSSKTPGARISIGGHYDGFNALHVDGHASFLPLTEKMKLTEMVKNLVFDGTNVSQRFLGH